MLRRGDHDRADLRAVVAVLPELAELLDHLRAERVRRRPVEPDDRDRRRASRAAPSPSVEARVGLRVGEEALAGLACRAGPARPGGAGSSAARSSRPTRPRRARAPASISSRPPLVGARERAGQDAGAGHHPGLDVLAGSRRPPRARGRPRRKAFSVKRSTTALVCCAVACSIATPVPPVLVEALAGLLAEVARRRPAPASPARRRSGRRMTRCRCSATCSTVSRPSRSLRKNGPIGVAFASAISLSISCADAPDSSL